MHAGLYAKKIRWTLRGLGGEKLSIVNLYWEPSPQTHLLHWWHCHLEVAWQPGRLPEATGPKGQSFSWLQYSPHRDLQIQVMGTQEIGPTAGVLQKEPQRLDTQERKFWRDRIQDEGSMSRTAGIDRHYYKLQGIFFLFTQQAVLFYKERQNLSSARWHTCWLVDKEVMHIAEAVVPGQLDELMCRGKASLSCKTA